MPTLPRPLLDELTGRISALSEASKAVVAEAILSYEWEDVADLRRYACELLEQVCSTACDDAAQLTADFYDAEREIATGERLGASPEHAREPAATERAVRALAQSVVDTGEAGRFAAECAARVGFEVRRASEECMVANGRRDPERPRFARVPSGSETCAFCLMLASRGFDYLSEESASQKAGGGHYHDMCDCRVVAGFSGMDVEGYDPEGLYARYKACHDAVADEYGHASTSDVLNEMRRRDPEWLRTGKPCEVTKEVGARPLPKELQAARWLSEQGFPVVFRATRSTQGKKTSDVLINGQAWEIKQPVGNGKQTIYHQFEEAARQSKRLVIDISEVVKPESGERWTQKKVTSEVEKLARWRYKDDSENTVQFEEVILLKEDWMMRIKKGS